MRSSTTQGRGRQRAGAVAIAAVIGLGAVVLPAAAEAKPQKVKVMTRNLYLGADLTSALLAPNQVELFERAFKVTDNVRETNFTARSRKLADEIQATKPDLIGLQEVALWRRGPIGVFDGPQTPAEEVVYDFLDELTNQIENRGLDYKVAVVQEETDFEVPIDDVDDDQLGDGGNPSNMRDARLTMRDVILVKKGVKIKNTASDQYDVALPIDLAPDSPPGMPGPEDIIAPRGYTYADVLVGGKRRGEEFRFINTHLEAFSAFIRNAQASELVNSTDATDTNKPVVLLGDLNSDPDDPSISPSPPEPIATANAAAFNTIASAGFVDRGTTENTCCHDADLLNAATAFSSRIDHVLTNDPDNVLGLSADLIGDDPAMKTPSGLWPSDHGGVVAKLRIK